jgi:hypothetical protein
VAVDLSPLQRLAVHQGLRTDSRGPAVAAQYGPVCTRPACVTGDKGCSYPRIRQRLQRHSIRVVVPRRSDQHPADGRHRFDKKLCRKWCTVKQRIGWLKERRWSAAGFEKLVVTLPAKIYVAFIERYLRATFSDRAQP